LHGGRTFITAARTSHVRRAGRSSAAGLTCRYACRIPHYAGLFLPVPAGCAQPVRVRVVDLLACSFRVRFALPFATRVASSCLPPGCLCYRLRAPDAGLRDVRNVASAGYIIPCLSATITVTPGYARRTMGTAAGSLLRVHALPYGGRFCRRRIQLRLLTRLRAVCYRMIDGPFGLPYVVLFL